MEIIKDLLSAPAKDFEEHLALKNNHRIIFSGKFGAGKTTFLKYFFGKDEESLGKHYDKKKDNVFHLFPVNYSISRNEDIMNYIKYDLLFEILSQNIEIKDEDVKYLKAFPGFMKKNFHKVAAALVSMIPQVGKDVFDAFEKLDKIKDDFFTHAESEENLNQESKHISEYIEKIENAEGSIYENTIITKILENILSRIKTPGIENVLIIDDLDRIDPEHLFRILNVFSAHFDKSNQGGNKLPIDKIILVCDITNVRNIFSSKYGQNVDFSGYIDKFYSHEIYYFDNKKNIHDIVDKKVKSLTITHDNQGTQFNRLLHNRSIISWILEEFVLQDIVNLRSILRLNSKQLKIDVRTMQNFSSGGKVYLIEYPIALQIDALCKILGGYEIFSIHLRKFNEITKEHTLIENHCKRMLLLLSHDVHKFHEEDMSFRFEKQYITCYIKTSKFRERGDDLQVTTLDMTKQIPYQFTSNDFIALFKATVNLLFTVKYLK